MFLALHGVTGTSTTNRTKYFTKIQVKTMADLAKLCLSNQLKSITLVHNRHAPGGLRSNHKQNCPQQLATNLESCRGPA